MDQEFSQFGQFIPCHNKLMSRCKHRGWPVLDKQMCVHYQINRYERILNEAISSVQVDIIQNIVMKNQ